MQYPYDPLRQLSGGKRVPNSVIRELLADRYIILTPNGDHIITLAGSIALDTHREDNQ